MLSLFLPSFSQHFITPALQMNNLINNGSKQKQIEEEQNEDDLSSRLKVKNSDEERMVPHCEHSNDSDLKQTHSPRQPLDCIPVETVLQEGSLPEGSYLSSECFGQPDQEHCSFSPDQVKRK